MDNIPPTPTSSPCIVCSPLAEALTPKRKIKLCSKECYDDMIKSVEAYRKMLDQKTEEMKAEEAERVKK